MNRSNRTAGPAGIVRPASIAPVEFLPTDAAREPEEVVGLCLSGGGYRAMLFHTGALLRLFETGHLGKVARISSVSGGSIVAGVLALAWSRLTSRDAFLTHIVGPVRRMADRTIDKPSILGGIMLPGTIGARIAAAYDEHLFGGATLQDLPDTPRFVFNATNLETGSLARFSKRYVRDWRIGEIASPTFRLADAVAASSAFPPVLSPFVLDVEPSDFTQSEAELPDSFRSEISLTDGGVYDNLGLETIWKRCRTVLVSDGGGLLTPDPSPPGDWARQAKRVLELVDQQVRNLRKRQVIDSFEAGIRRGAYWGIRTDVLDYGLADPLGASHDDALALAETPTRLKRLDGQTQEKLINWGYAVCDAALRRHVDQDVVHPGGFPYQHGI